MMQGDACYLGIEIRNSAGSPVVPADVRDVEITVGGLKKTYLAEQLSSSGGVWLFPLSQGESYAISPGPVPAQVRIAWANGVVEGCRLYGMYMEESLHKEVL